MPLGIRGLQRCASGRHRARSLGPGIAVFSGAAGGVSIIGVLMGGRAGVANGRGLLAPLSGLSLFFPCCCKAFWTIACTFADTGAAAAAVSPRFPIVARTSAAIKANL